MKSFSITILLTLLLALPLHAEPGQPSKRNIPERKISELQTELDESENIASSTQQRRAFKNLVRDAQSLLKRYPDSSNRFDVLTVVFAGQQTLLTLQDSAKNREALLETCQQLRAAPDDYAMARLPADILMSQIELEQKDPTPAARAMALAELADRYRGTPAEAQSLIAGCAAAFDLGEADLLKAFRKTLSKRFAHDPLVNAFMRERFAASSEMHISGSFASADGKQITFPIGQSYIVCFWSNDAPILKEKCAEIKALQDSHKGELKVFSFNLDELRDAGQGTLTRMKLDWIPMNLPGGVNNPTYLSVGGANMFTTLVIDPYGLAAASKVGTNHAAARPIPIGKKYAAATESSRRLALLRSLCIGDFLVTDASDQLKTMPLATYRAIQDCFPPAPLRYRLTPDQAMKNYQNAEQLCVEAIAQHANAPDLWLIHHRRIIALLGIWRFTGDMEVLDRAVTAAKEALAMMLPDGAITVPQFCLATRALRDADADAAQVLTSFINAAGGDAAPGSAHAAALMLSLDAHSTSQFIKFRDSLLGKHASDPTTWPVSSYLLDPATSSRLFGKALPDRGKNIPTNHTSKRELKATLTAVDGTKLELPTANNSSLRALVMIEGMGDQTTQVFQKRVIDHLTGIATARPLKDLEVTGVFLGSDPTQVTAWMAKNKWEFNTLCLPESDWYPLARQIGIFSADRTPNIYLLRPDGSIELALTGVSPDAEKVDTFNFRFGTALRNYDLALADKALAEKNYAQYATHLQSSFPLKELRRNKNELEAPHGHGRKLAWAYMQAEQWQQALDAINRNISSHEKHWSGKMKKYDSCTANVSRLATYAELLRMTGKTKEATEATALAKASMCPTGGDIAPILATTKAAIEGRDKRFGSAADQLRNYQTNTRRIRQSLYVFKLENDLMMRSKIYEKLGQNSQAAADRQRATALAWPCPPAMFAMHNSAEASTSRRKIARQQLNAKQWQQVVDLTTTNITIHQAEALRCDSACKICGVQGESFKHRVATLKNLGDHKAADASLAMIDATTCPGNKVNHTFQYFPINRMHGGGTGKNRLNFIDTHMRGENPYANQTDRTLRMELASDLIMRSQALAQLKQPAEAIRDQKRAAALAFPLGPNATQDADDLPTSYVNILRSETP